jgi:glycosyltransferase involved in cell wall biosynthesis
VIIAGTSPPLLIVAAALLALWHRARLAHWLFDMYPELAIALGEVPRGGLAIFFEKITRWAYRRCDLVVALDKDMAERLARFNISSEVIAPWVFETLISQAVTATDALPPTKCTWLYSGNLGRAHEWQTLLDAQSLLERRSLPWKLVFQGGGPSWPLAQQRARELGLGNCEWKPYVEERELRESLLRTEVLTVTQRPETRGLLWPSKLGLVTTLPRRILWIGPADGAIARELSSFPQAGIFSPGQADEIADWLTSAPAPVASFKKRDAATVRQGSLEKWTNLLEKLRPA